MRDRIAKGLEISIRLITFGYAQFQFFGVLLKFFRQSLSFRDVPSNLRKPKQRTVLGSQRRYNHAGPKARTIFSNAPTFGLIMSVVQGGSQDYIGHTVLPVLVRVKPREVLADDFRWRVALHPLRTWIPTGDRAVGIESEDCIILHCLDQEPIAFFNSFSILRLGDDFGFQAAGACMLLVAFQSQLHKLRNVFDAVNDETHVAVIIE